MSANLARQVPEKATVQGLMAHDKRFADVAAKLALRGFALHPLACGGYLIARHDLTSFAPDLRGASSFLEMVTRA